MYICSLQPIRDRNEHRPSASVFGPGRPQGSHLHIEYVIEPSDPEKLHQFGIDMPDRESSTHGVDPFLQTDQSPQGRAGDEMNVAQIQNQMIPGFQCNRVRK